jgi:DNA-binding NtrC family response regulator
MNRILVVDDEPLTLYSLSILLRDDGEVTTVSNGSDAIRASQHCFYDLCLLDLGLPDMGGIDVMFEIGKLSPKSKIMVMSSSCVSDTDKELIEKSAYFFIPKPFELAYLKAIVRRAMKEEGTRCGHGDNRRNSFANEQRRLERTPFSRKISYTINALDQLDFPELEAQVVDISEVGMGIVTGYPVKTGSVIRFDMMYDTIDYKAGVVANTCVVNDGLFRAGIEFV